MNWFRENRWLGTFLIVFGVCVLVALYLLFSAKSGFEAATNQFNEAATERNRLEHLDPFPSEANFQKMQQFLQGYRTALDQWKGELKKQTLEETPLAPNEFQTRLRQASNAAADKAKVNKVKLPDDFHLGFDEYTAALPVTADAAKLLGQELAQIDLLVSILLDARVDAITDFKRMQLPEEKGANPLPTPAGRKPAGPGAGATGPKMLERSIVDLAFTSSPSAMRKVLNQVATANQQFFIIRSLYVKNEQEKGPPREKAAGAESAASAAAAPAPAPGASPAKAAPTSALKFIVGNEHIETTARVEIVRFTY
jgi:hypothetical protein